MFFHFLLFICFFSSLHSEELSPQSFSSLASYLYTKYQENNLKTSWHQDLYHNFLDGVAVDEKNLSAEELFTLGVKREYLDQMAIEYVKQKTNTFIVVLFPGASHAPEGAFEILNDFGTIVYKKPISLNQNGMKYFLKSLYDVHHCNGWLPTYEGVFSRFRHLLKEGEVNCIWAILWEGESLEKAIACKKVIRTFYDSNEACHFNDRHFETLHNAENLFNQNTIDFLNYSQPKNYGVFVECARKLKEYIAKDPSFRDSYAIDAGGVLAALGIRPCSDFDMIVSQGLLPPFLEFGHDNFTREKLGFCCDDLIYNPNNYFYHKGLRFLTIEKVREYKEKKGSEKDKKDLVLIDDYLERKKRDQQRFGGIFCP